MVDQIVIGVCGVTSVFCSQSAEDRVRRWACIFGISAQPFWLYTTITAGQWDIAALSLLYAYGWWRGIRLHWLKR